MEINSTNKTGDQGSHAMELPTDGEMTVPGEVGDKNPMFLVKLWIKILLFLSRSWKKSLQAWKM